MDELENIDFEPLPEIVDGADSADWVQRANLVLDANVRKARALRNDGVMFPRNWFGDLKTMFSGGGESGTCTPDGGIEWEGEREALVAQIMAARKKTIGTGLPCD